MALYQIDHILTEEDIQVSLTSNITGRLITHWPLLSDCKMKKHYWVTQILRPNHANLNG
jgi:hypothetical protein